MYFQSMGQQISCWLLVKNFETESGVLADCEITDDALNKTADGKKWKHGKLNLI